MGFLSIKNSSIYLTIDSTAKPIRPLSKEAISLWCRSIPACDEIGPDNKPRNIRKFRMVDSNFSQWMKNNPDPLWDKLDKKDKFDIKTGERRDFSTRPQHVLPVWSYSDNDVKVVKQGNQFFEEMDKFYNTGNDVTTCDWMCWFEGSGRTKKYKTSRQNPTPFQANIDQQVLQAKVKAYMDQAMAEFLPFKTEEDLIKYIHGDMQPLELPQGNAQPALPMPGYTPGGSSGVMLGSIPTLPNSNPQPQPPPYVPQQPPYVPQQPQSQPPPYVPQQPQSQPPPYVPQQPQSQPPPYVPQQPPYVPQQPQSQPPPYVPQQPQSQPPPYVPQQPQSQTPQTQQSQEQVPPNAPVNSAPVFAPPASPPPAVVTHPHSAPGSTTINFGKYEGKTLLWVRDNDPNYLSYLKGNKRELSDEIEAIMSAPNTQPVANSQQTVVPNGNEEELRSALVKEINEKILKIPEFQGKNIMNMMTFLNQTIGTANFSDAPYQQLVVLKSSIDQKLGL